MLRVEILRDEPARIGGFQMRPGEFAAMATRKIPPRDAVLHGHDDGIGADEVVQIGRDRPDLMRLHGEEYHVVDAGLLHGLGGLEILHVDLGAVLLDQAHAVGADGIEIGPACDEGDVLADIREANPQKSADGACADDRDAHAGILIVRMSCRSGLCGSGEAVRQDSDPLDLHLDRGAFRDRAGTVGGAAGDDVAGLQRHAP